MAAKEVAGKTILATGATPPDKPNPATPSGPPAGPPAGPALISVNEFAARMGISTTTARRLCYARTVATVKFNRSLLVPATEVDRLIQAHLQPVRPTAGQAS